MASKTTKSTGAVVGVLVALLTVWYLAIYAKQPAPEQKLVEAPKQPPQLYCVLIRVTGEPRLEFLFNISQVGNEFHFDQVFLVEIWSTDKTVKQPPFPPWKFDANSDLSRLESEISVYDNSAAGSHMEKITLELYGYRPDKVSRGWIESGLKSVYYQNLSGQCQQKTPVTPVATKD